MVTVANLEYGYNLDMTMLLNNLRTYHPSEACANLKIDQDSDIELEHIATYISMKDNSIVTIAAGRKINTSGEYDQFEKVKLTNSKDYITRIRIHSIGDTLAVTCGRVYIT